LEIGLIKSSATSHRYVGLHGLAVLVIALVVVCCGSERAVASCGDYLLDRAMFDHATSGDSSPTRAGLSEAGNSIPSRPCDGPSCRQLPLGPAPTTPASHAGPELERWCVTAASATLRELPVVGSRESTGIVLPTGPVSRIDRPPQA